MNRFLAAGFLAVLVTLGTAAAQDITLSPGELDSLGIAFEAPERAEAGAMISASARVVVPPSADHVVASPVGGLVERVHVGIGDRVRAGQPLLDIRSTAFVALQQQYLEARADASVAVAQRERDRQLFDEGIIAERRFEEARARAAAAESRLAEHSQLLAIAGLRSEDMRRLDDSAQLFDTLVVRAPADGVVLDVMTRAGQNADPVDALARVAELETLWLDIRVPQDQAHRVLPGATVIVRDGVAAPAARVLGVGQAVDPATQAVPVRAEIIGSDHGLRPGQLVAVTISSGEAGRAERAAVSIPAAALVRSGDAAFVFLRSPDGVKAIPVTVGAPAAGRVIVFGVEPDADVAVSGVSALKALLLASAEGGS